MPTPNNKAFVLHNFRKVVFRMLANPAKADIWNAMIPAQGFM